MWNRRMKRILIVPLAVLAMSAFACGDEDMDPEPPDETSEVASELTLEPAPLCATTSETESKEEPCGIKPDGDGGYVTVYKTCTRTCTTRRRLKLEGLDLVCVSLPTICSQWACESCPL